MSEKLNELEKKLRELKNLKQVKRYVSFAERVITKDDNKSKKSEFDYDNSDLGLARVIDKSNEIILDYPILDKKINLLWSTFEHDPFMMDILSGLFLRFKHIEGVATDKANEVIINISKSLSLNESEKRNPIINLKKVLNRK